MTTAAKKISEFEKIVDPQAKNDPTQTYWFVARGSVLKGPFTQSELENKLQSKEVSFFDYAWKQGFSEWRNLGSISELSNLSSAVGFESYPSIPVPGKITHTPPIESTTSAPSSRRRKDIEVRLRTANKNLFSVRQSFFIVMFAISVAWITNSWFQKQLSRNFEDFFQHKTAGRTFHLGKNVNSSPDARFWEPLFSAPGFSDNAKNQHLEAHVFGFVQKHKSEAELEGFQIQNRREELSHETSFTQLDPIFVRPVYAEGQLNPLNGNKFRVESSGEPYLSNYWHK